MNEIVIIAIVTMILMIYINYKESNIIKINKCKIHNWVVDYNNNMFCSICKVKPGDEND